MASQKIAKNFIVSRAGGLQLPFAAEFAETAARFVAVVTVINQGRVADGKSIMPLLMLGAQRGAVVTVTIEGPDAQAALQAIEALCPSEC
jgi:phosphotransferase system HPr (HPr) family protein